MKKVFMFLVVIALLLVGCAGNQKSESNNDVSKREDASKTITTESVPEVSEIDVSEEQTICSDYMFSENGEIYNYLDTLNILCEKGENYEIYSNSGATGHYYVVYDNNKSFIDDGYCNFKRPEFERYDDILVLEKSHGMSIVSKKFYNVENAKVSRWYEMVFAHSGEIIAYYSTSCYNPDQNVIVVANMFDSTKYYNEFPRDISVSSLMMASYLGAEFIEDDKQFKITYTNTNDEEVTEIFDLP